MIGKVFHEVVADANVKFEVVSKEAPGIYKCISKGNPYGEYDGTTRLKSKAELDAIFNREKLWEDLDKAAYSYVASLNVGDIVHYHHGFGIFIQCEVVESNKEGNGEWSDCGLALKQIALIGNVKGIDLPSIERGRIYTPYLSKNVLESDTPRGKAPWLLSGYPNFLFSASLKIVSLELYSSKPELFSPQT
jgi:hypothetical protein